MTDFIEKNISLGPNSDAPLVAILLCTYNGDHFLVDQLNSLEVQTHQNWIVFASDDGSTDQTLEILGRYQAKWPPGKMTIRSGSQKGFCHNFLSLACDSEIKADYYAFCDQDDVWLSEKLDVALRNILTNQTASSPYLYCGRTKYVNVNLKPCGMSPLFVFPPSFRNALVQSIAGGNTMVFNQYAKDKIEQAGILNVASHDWWIYQLITGVGGEVFYDPVSRVLYRQHQYALVGGNNSFMAKIKRMKMLFKGRFQQWNTQNLIQLNQVKEMIKKENNIFLELFQTLRSAKIKDRLRLLGVCGLYRQTRAGTISLYIAVILKKV